MTVLNDRAVFLSTPSARRATLCVAHSLPALPYFYPRPPRGGRLCFAVCGICVLKISIHALREEGDTMLLGALIWTPNFYPRPPRGGRPERRWAVRRLRYFYPRPPRGGRLISQGGYTMAKKFLSTPSARRATLHFLVPESLCPISIHALREEGDERCMMSKKPAIDFYPRPPRGGRPAEISRISDAMRISIHSLREEGDRRV